MALWEFKNLNKYGNVRTRIVNIPPGRPLTLGKGLGRVVYVRRFVYEYKHSYLPPILYSSPDGKRYLVPSWVEVHKGTTLKDIVWVKPIPKSPIETITHEMKSSSSGVIYKVKETIENGEIKYRCNCPGFARAYDKTKACKHVQKLKNT